MNIDKEVLKQTTKCEKSFSCLKNTNHVYCKVESCVSKKVHFIKCLNNDEYCVYKMAFGTSFVCNCPTRKEIFNKFEI